MERGVVTFEWTYEHPRVGAQQGQSRLAFDRWGRRQFTSGNPGPNGDQVVIVDTTKMTTYLPQQRSAVTLPWKAVEAFTPEERKLLEQAFPVNQLPATKTKVVAGIPCLETALERNLPGGGVLVHTACVGKGIILESTDTVSGGVLGDSRSHLIATTVDLEADVPEALFEIPADVSVIDMGKRYEDPSTRQRVLDAVRTTGAEKATPESDAAPADENAQETE